MPDAEAWNAILLPSGDQVAERPVSAASARNRLHLSRTGPRC